MTNREDRVVLADTDRKARQLAAKVLDAAGYVTIEAEDGFAALESARLTDTALVLLEVELPGLSGYEVCRELRRERGNELPIFFLSGTRTEPLDRVTGFLLGADDFIVKPFDASELIARVDRFVSRRAAPRSPAPAPEQPAGTQPTAREREVLDLLADGLGQKEIALRLSLSSKTVGTHIQHLLVKLSVHSRAELIAYAFRQGLVSPLHDRRSRSANASETRVAAVL